MRILLYFNYDLSEYTGIARYADYIASLLTDEGHEVTLVGSASGEPVCVARTKVVRSGRMAHLRVAVLALIEAVRSKANVVLLSQLGSPFNGALSVALRCFGKPIVYVCMDPPVEIIPLVYPNLRLKKVVGWLLSASEALVNRASSATLSVSEGVDELLRKRGWRGPILRFRNIHGTQVTPQPPDPLLREQPGWRDSTILVYAGALQPGIRGIEEQIRALALVPRDVNVRLVLVGRNYGVDFSLLAKSLGVGDRVRVLDPVDPKKLSAILAACDVAAFKSLSYALPSKVFEYVAHGLKLISWDGASDVNALLAEFVEAYDGSDTGLARALGACSARPKTYDRSHAATFLARLREESRRDLFSALAIAVQGKANQ